MAGKNFRLCGIERILCAICLFGLCACSNTDPLPTLNAGEISAINNRCEQFHLRHVEAWNTKESETLRGVYTPDIVHFDGYPVFVGIDEVIKMANNLFIFFDRWEMKAGETYISQQACLGATPMWNIFGFTSEDPGMQYDLLETRKAKISFWRVFSEGELLQESTHDSDPIDEDLLARFSAAWSSHNAGKVMNLYAKSAMLEDTLFGISVTGTQAMKDYVKAFMAKSSGASWELLQPFAEAEAALSFKDQYPFPSQGGIFAVSDNDASGAPCQLRLAVILTPDEEGRITNQIVFYDASTLLACGWAN